MAALVTPCKRSLTVRTSIPTIICNKGTALLVVDRETDVVVYDLHDNARHDVMTIADGKMFEMRPAEELVFTRDGRTFEQINPGYGIVDEHPKLFTNGRMRVFMTNFSLTSALIAVPAAKALITSDDPRERNLGDKIMKNAAVMAHMLGGAN